MFELIAVATVCATVLVILFAVLGYFKDYRIERDAWLNDIRGELLGKVDERLASKANFQQDMLVLHESQLNIAKEIELLKAQMHLKSTIRPMQRPPTN